MAIMQQAHEEDHGARLVVFGCIALAALLLLGSIESRNRGAIDENAADRIQTAAILSSDCSGDWQMWSRENPEKMLQLECGGR